MKKKEFKAAIAAKLVEQNSTDGKEFKVDEVILESSTCKLGRKIREENGVMEDWPEKEVNTVVEFYNDYGKKPEKPETAKEKPAKKKASSKSKVKTTKAKTPAKPLRDAKGHFISSNKNKKTGAKSKTKKK